MLSNKNAEQAAKLIWDCWENGRTIDKLPFELRPQTRAEGYTIQAYFEKFSNQPIFGWKIAATSKAGQSHIGVKGPLAGRILQERVFSAGATLSFGDNKMAVAEPELAFRIGQTLEPRRTEYSKDEVISSVDTLHPAIEIPNSRFKYFADVGEEQLIADNACAHEFVIGAAMTDLWKSTNLANHNLLIKKPPSRRKEGKEGQIGELFREGTAGNQALPALAALQSLPEPLLFAVPTVVGFCETARSQRWTGNEVTNHSDFSKEVG